MSMADAAGQFWNPRFSAEEYAYGKAPNDFVREASARLRGSMRVLSIGDGEGRNGVFLASLGHRVTSLDASSAANAKAQRLALEKGVELETVLADLWSWSMPRNSYDAVVSVYCHLPPELRRRVHAQIVQGLRPGGVLILEGYTPRQLLFGTGGPKQRELLYSADVLVNELRGLKVELCREVEREVVEGRFHTGRASVVQLIASKPVVKKVRKS